MSSNSRTLDEIEADLLAALTRYLAGNEAPANNNDGMVNHGEKNDGTVDPLMLNVLAASSLCYLNNLNDVKNSTIDFSQLNAQAGPCSHTDGGTVDTTDLQHRHSTDELNCTTETIDEAEQGKRDPVLDNRQVSLTKAQKLFLRERHNGILSHIIVEFRERFPNSKASEQQLGGALQKAKVKEEPAALTRALWSEEELGVVRMNQHLSPSELRPVLMRCPTDFSKTLRMIRQMQIKLRQEAVRDRGKETSSENPA